MRIALALLIALSLTACGTEDGAIEITSTTSEIINGDPATITDFPFMVSLRDLDGHNCSGTLIAKRVVLTAAHCIGGLTEAIVGVTNVVSGVPTANRINVEDQAKHPLYDPTTDRNDVGLVLLETSALDAGASLIRLNDDPYWDPSPGGPIEPTPAGTKGWIAGWGCTNTPFGGLCTAPSPILRKGKTQLGDWYACRDWADGLIIPRQVFGSQLCIEHSIPGQAMPCIGDSGGPFLVVDHDGEWLQLGIDSWGGPLCVGHYSVYSRLTYYFDQIWQGIQDLWGPIEVPPDGGDPT